MTIDKEFKQNYLQLYIPEDFIYVYRKNYFMKYFVALYVMLSEGSIYLL